MPTQNKDLFLTFDDGPHPEITAFVLDELNRVGAKATFFCVGKNAEKHPALLMRIRQEGHSVGNHSYSHMNGWKSNYSDYLNDVQRCDAIVKSQLFRPPYGRISLRQFVKLKASYKIILWDVLTLDYRNDIEPTQCVDIVMDNISNGSIIAFHDSEKAWPRLKIALPEILNRLISQGFTFKAIPEI
jgi:peptidoglycan-N-acetylglucosamine deacetylase